MEKKSKIFFANQVLSFLKTAKAQQHKLGFRGSYEYTNLRDAMFELLMERDCPLDIDISKFNGKEKKILQRQLANGITSIVKSRLNHETPSMNVTKNVYSIAQVLLSR